MANIPNAASISQTGLSANPTISGLTNPLSNIAALRTLGAGTASGTANNYYMLSSLGGTTAGSQYQVTTGKTLYVFTMTVSTDTSSKLLFGYGTAALGSDDTATPPTGVVVYAPANTATHSSVIIPSQTPVGTILVMPLFMSFPALSYPFIKMSAGGDWHVRLDCIEL